MAQTNLNHSRDSNYDYLVTLSRQELIDRITYGILQIDPFLNINTLIGILNDLADNSQAEGNDVVITLAKVAEEIISNPGGTTAQQLIGMASDGISDLTLQGGGPTGPNTIDAKIIQIASQIASANPGIRQNDIVQLLQTSAANSPNATESLDKLAQAVEKNPTGPVAQGIINKSKFQGATGEATPGETSTPPQTVTDARDVKINQIASQIAGANPGVNENDIVQLLQQLAANTGDAEQALNEIAQEVESNPAGPAAQNIINQLS